MSQASIMEAQRLRKKMQNLQMIEELLKRQAEISITSDGLEEYIKKRKHSDESENVKKKMKMNE